MASTPTELWVLINLHTLVDHICTKAARTRMVLSYMGHAHHGNTVFHLGQCGSKVQGMLPS